MKTNCRKPNVTPWGHVVLVSTVLGFAGLACLPAAGQEFVPFVISSRIDPQEAIWIAEHKAIAPDSERLVAFEHFHHRGRQVRIWGVNLCFGANFPSHAEAPHIATRLAAAGVNSVRCHHMDTARWPRGIWNAKDGRTIEPQALDRLDYFIHELAQRGIWININLHVGRTHSEYLGLPRTTSNYDKVVGIFTPALIDAQKQYARDLLTHVNPYRKIRYADDPAVAFVEITNEDSFFMWDGDKRLRNLPPHHAKILQDRFNDWLERRYESEQALRTAWAKDTQSLGPNRLRNGAFTHWDSHGPQHWNLERHEDCQARLSHGRRLGPDGIQIDSIRANGTEWHLQLTQGGFALTGGQYYTVSFEASSVRTRTVNCGVSQAHDPWGNLGLSRHIELRPEWKKFTCGFVATADESNARISFAFAGDSTGFSLASVEVRPGGQVGLAESETPQAGTVELFQENAGHVRILDRMLFLAETEKAYFDNMRSYIRDDLGCGALVTGTIVFGPLGLYAQSDMDFIDAHAYWQHPRFPGRPWDPGNWTVEQKAMTDHPREATLFRLAAERLFGKPFTVSEYNHPAPADAQAECVPMIASFAAAQDWDGLWLFTYSHATDDWNREMMSGFFDIDTNPAKWGFMRAGTAIFRNGCITPLNGPVLFHLAGRQTDNVSVLPRLAASHLQHDRNMLNAAGLQPEAMLKAQRAAALGGHNGDRNANRADTEIDWVARDKDGIYAVQSRAGSVYAGHAKRFREVTDGNIDLTAPEFVALTITPLDNEISVPLEKRASLLISTCGRCENTDMQFSADRRTVGRDWGQAPVRIEPVEGVLVLPNGQWTCHALAADGSKDRQVPIGQENSRPTLRLSPEYETMWYLVERITK